MSAPTNPLALDVRTGLPQEWLFLLEKHPRPVWHENPGLGQTGEIWLGNHGYFRSLSSYIGEATDSLWHGQLDPIVYSEILKTRAGALLSGLEGHHRIEDEHYFPKFSLAEPRLIHGFELLDADHRAMHEAIENFSRSAHTMLAAMALADGSLTPGVNQGAEEFSRFLIKFQALLARHLDDEEDLVIPLIIERAAQDPEFG